MSDWESMADKVESEEKKTIQLNPKAPAFKLSPDAASFVPAHLRAKMAADSGKQAGAPEQSETDGAAKPDPQNPEAPKETADSTTESKGAESPKPSNPSDVNKVEEKTAKLTVGGPQSASGGGGGSGAAAAKGAKTPTPTAAAANDSSDDDGFAERQRERRAKLTQFDSRDHMNVVFIGHVDAGKSTLSGNILYMTGQVDARTIDKFEREAKTRNRESWFLAYIMDTNDEERSKGKTVEVGRAHFETTNKRFTVLDAPGHKNYVPNMIQGAAQADVGVLVISARKGEFETGFERGGQTREHTMLAKTLGVRQLIVVVNKMDESTVQWSEDRYNMIVDKLGPFLKQAGYNPKKHVQFLPISGLSGANIVDPVDKSVCPWFDGPSLMQALDALPVRGRDPDAPLRVPVLDRWNERGTMLIGKVESGTLIAGEEVVIYPTKNTARVEKVYIDANEVDMAKPGENVSLRLKDVKDEDVHKGFVLCTKSKPSNAVTLFQAQLMLLDLEHRPIFTAGYSAVMHIHTCDEEVTVEALLAEIDKKSGEPKKNAAGRIIRPRFVKSGSICIVRMRTAKSVCMETFDNMQQLGRFTLRDEGRTIGIGKVTKLIELV